MNAPKGHETRYCLISLCYLVSVVASACDNREENKNDNIWDKVKNISITFIAATAIVGINKSRE